MRNYLLLLLVLFSMGCERNLTEPIPQRFVDFTVDLNQAGNGNLTGIGGYITVPNEGVKGIIVYHRGQDDYAAFDKSCSYRQADACAIIQVDSSLLTATDPCCESRFLLSDGSPIVGPATLVLKQYFVTRSGSVLHITN